VNRTSNVKRTAFSVERVVKKKREEKKQNKFVSHITLGFFFVITNAGSVAIPLLMRLLPLLSHGQACFTSPMTKSQFLIRNIKKVLNYELWFFTFSFAFLVYLFSYTLNATRYTLILY